MRLSVITAVLAPVFLVSCSPAKAPPIKGAFTPARITHKVYVIHGPNELPNKRNQGFMNNPGFVLTSKGVVVIDPGSSVQVGEMVLTKIAAVTKDPVIAVFNTHIHGDHWLGNQAIKAVFPKAVIYAHANMKAKTGAEGENWVKMLNQLTEGAVRGTQPLGPDATLDNDETLKLGDTQFRIYHNGKAHTDGDLMIEVVGEKVMFLGDNVNNGRLGRMDDGHFLGNIAAIDIALKTGAQHFVPGHGPSNGREVLKGFHEYLKTLHATVKKYYDQGLADFEMKPQVAEALAQYKAWTEFDNELGRHISLAYQQIQADAF